MTRLPPLCLALAPLLFAAPCLATKPDAAPATCTGPVKPVLFLSPMGEPFRPKPGGGDPAGEWFAQADRDHDGKLTIAELMLDADRFFALLDKDHDGELLPDEVAAYEENIAPEVRLYQARPAPRDGERDRDRDRRERHERDQQQRPRRLKSGESGYDGAMGAGRYAFLNIPNPVAAADADINRAIDRAEFRQAAADRFRELDPGQRKALALADLPVTPARRSAEAACIAAEKAAARGKPRRSDPHGDSQDRSAPHEPR